VILLLLQILGAIGRQDLPREGCAAYLWTLAEPRQMVAMAEPGLLRLTLDGKPVDLARTAAEGSAGLGLAATTRYAADGVSATLELTVQEQPNMTKGALAPAATLTVARAGGDAVVTPVAGMVGCR
jgi:hypothetical protein